MPHRRTFARPPGSLTLWRLRCAILAALAAKAGSWGMGNPSLDRVEYGSPPDATVLKMNG